MRNRSGIYYNIDWITVLLYLFFVFFGLINIYSSACTTEQNSIFDLSQEHGKQLIWISFALLLGIIILMIDSKVFSTFAYFIYAFSILILIAVLLFGSEVSGSKSWFRIGNFGIQPSEFAKFATCLAIAKYLTTLNVSLKKFKCVLKALALVIIPAFFILLQRDTGSALVYGAFIIVLYREGLSGSILLLGIFAAILFVLTLLFDKFILIGSLSILIVLVLIMFKKIRKHFWQAIGFFILMSAFIFSIDFAVENVLEQHQIKRLNVLIGKEDDIHGAGYNVNQSKIAIGSGGLAGKGFLKGTQTKYDFVPEQSTDFIFCTIGEEWGFLGTALVIILFILFLIRLVQLAERQRSRFSRIYGYGVASILFFHFMINIGMTIGLTPVIGIPLPFFSYGGSSLWAFTILLFIFLRQDAARLEKL